MATWTWSDGTMSATVCPPPGAADGPLHTATTSERTSPPLPRRRAVTLYGTRAHTSLMWSVSPALSLILRGLEHCGTGLLDAVGPQPTTV